MANEEFKKLGKVAGETNYLDLLDQMKRQFDDLFGQPTEWLGLPKKQEIKAPVGSIEQVDNEKM